MAPVGEVVDTQEFIFSQANGKSFVQVLPADWVPQYEGSFLRINNRTRMLALDVLIIRPRVQLDVSGLQWVRLVRRNESVSRSGTYDMWVSAGSQDLLGTNHSLDLVKMAPQTWLRPNDFRLLIER